MILGLPRPENGRFQAKNCQISTFSYRFWGKIWQKMPSIPSVKVAGKSKEIRI